jgi:uncharacterized protein YeaO (DUF488 family)
VIRREGFRAARIYDPLRADDGWRVLVDRLWPRGLTRDGAPIDEWCPEVAPSAQLRRWYGHQPDRFPEFSRRYQHELQDPQRDALLQQLRARAARQRVSLLTATKDVANSHAAVLLAVLSSGTEELSDPPTSPDGTPEEEGPGCT